MKVITSKEIGSIYYPVGENMSHNKEAITALVNEFAKIEVFKHRDLNIIGMGSSGTIIATFFHLLLPNKSNIINVKKENEQAHDTWPSLLPEAANVIVDDFIDTGKTMHLIYDKLYEINRGNFHVDCVCYSKTYKELKFKHDYAVCSYV